MACSDDVMEGVFQRHRVIVGSLVLWADREARRESFKEEKSKINAITDLYLKVLVQIIIYLG